jgi:hypothetical protein
MNAHGAVERQHGMDYRGLLQQIGVDEETLMEFFTTFSRFEFALKKAGYLEECPVAKPDWRLFGTEHKDDFDPDKEPQLREAFDRLDKNPQMIQFAVDGELDFKVDRRLESMSPLEKAIHAVRTVRNNLFHGGRFPDSGIVDDPARKTKLLKACTILLEEMLEFDSELNTEFWANLD